jgi:hypothetical protein
MENMKTVIVSTRPDYEFTLGLFVIMSLKMQSGLCNTRSHADCGEGTAHQYL